MRLRTAGWVLLGLALMTMGPTPRSEAQILGPTNAIGGAGNYAGPGNFGYSGLNMSTVNFPRQGSWAEVLSVSPKGWMVLQDGEGKQYPVSADAIGMFVIRWSSSVEQIGPDALIEVTGADQGSNVITAEHVDAYQGGARSLVSPALQNIVGFNRVITPYDVDQMNTYGARYFLLPGEEQMPARTHVVGPPVGINPLQIGIGGNLHVTVMPPFPLHAPSVSQITPGSVGLVTRGDLAYFVADDALPKTLAVSQLVIYKKVSAAR